METPLVSVCMTTYNHEAYLRQAVESILAQETSFDVELVLGDDCSADSTAAICREYAAKYPGRVRFVTGERNVGWRANYRRTFEACRGKYVAYCDGDDWWSDPRKLQMQADLLESDPSCGMCYTRASNYYQNTGLTAPQKFLLQLAAAVAFLCLMRYEGMLSPNLYIPFFNTHLVLPWVVYMIFAAFVIIGTVNAVNITDGVDGLSSSVTVPVAVFFAVLGGLWQGCSQLGVFAGALVGGLLGFLFYNHYPAKVFMGDTGSLFLGGAVAALAFAYDMPLILLLVGFVYLCETLSDIIQVTYFKLTHGKRIFKMSPIHHHFEMCGWNENKICFVFSGVTLLAGIIGVLLAVFGC